MQINRRKLMRYGVKAGLSMGLYPIAATAHAVDPKVTDNSGIQVTTGSAFGTRWQLSTSRDVSTDTAIEIIDQVVQSVDQSMSPYHPHSELSVFNRLSTDTPFFASDALTTVVSASLDIAYDSNGAFDPTVGPIVNRYGFGPIIGHRRSGTGNPGRYSDISLDESTLLKTNPHATLDLCGIAKGYALDQVGRALSAAGYTDFLFELGGELVARGNRPRTRFSQSDSTTQHQFWIVGIDNAVTAPLTSKRAMMLRTSLTNTCIATSGISQNSYQFNNKRYSHLINPLQQRVAENSLFSVTVINESAMRADAWSTALYVLGEVAGPALATQLGLNALFIYMAPDGLRHTMTGNFGLLEG